MGAFRHNEDMEWGHLGINTMITVDVHERSLLLTNRILKPH